MLKWVAVVTWFITIDGGFVLLGFWLRGGGLRRPRPRGPRIGPELIAFHFSLAGTGFTLWIVYLVRGGRVYAVSALGILVLVATIGFTMFGIWLVHRVSLSPAAEPQRARPVDQHLPVTVILLHGLFAAATLILVALTVITST